MIREKPIEDDEQFDQTEDVKSSENNDDAVDEDENKAVEVVSIEDDDVDDGEKMLSNPSADQDDFFDDDDDDYYDDDEEFEVNHEEGSTSHDDQTDDPDKDVMNEEGSGVYRTSKTRSSYNKNRQRLEFSDRKYRKKQQKLLPDDDEDNEDDDESSRSHEGSGGNFNNDSNNDDEDDGFFSTKRKSGNKYFRKNTNDAIKIISTPHGKVGIVYQQTDNTENSKTGSSNSNTATVLSGLTELSIPGDKSYQQPKITPVLTADGKVALLYRGASENTKYEPILNLTHTFSISNNDNKTSAVKNTKNDDVDDQGFDDDSDGTDTVDETVASIGDGEDTNIVDLVDTSNNRANADDTISTESNPPLSGNEYESPILPNINRPLSEVLGIKKNQFKQFRIKDGEPTQSTSSTAADDGQEQRTITTINLNADNANNYDYDTNVDVTEYDFRNSERFNQILRNSQHDSNDVQMGRPNSKASTGLGGGNSATATAEILSKTEVVNLAIIPHFDEEFERRQQQHYRDEERRHHQRLRHRHRHNSFNQDLSGVHCIMQAMMGVAAVSTVFGMLGAFFKQRILDQIRLMHW